MVLAYLTAKGVLLTTQAIEIIIVGVPVVVQRKHIRLGTMRWRVQSLASLSGSRIWRCCELWCRSQMWLRSGVAEASGYSSDSTPSLGTIVCHGRGFGPKEKKSNPG